MAASITKTFTITIKGAPGAYTLEAEDPSGNREGPLPLELPGTWFAEHQTSLDKLAEDSASLAEIETLGRALYKVLFPIPIEAAFSAAKDGHTHLRLCLQIEPPELEALPWETLYDGKTWLAIDRATPLVRRLYQAREQDLFPALQVRGPLNILFVGASPIHGGKLLRIEDIIVGIEAAIPFQKARQDGKIRFVKLLNATYNDLKKALNEDYHIICFAAHGSPQGLWLDDGYGETVDVNGESQRGRGYDPVTMSARQLTALLEEHHQPTRLIFLASCETAALPDENARSAADETGQSDDLQHLRGFAQELVERTSLPAVVAMQYVFGVAQAADLAGYFFAALAAAHPIDVALAEARQVVLSTQQKMNRDVIAPVMYLQSREGLLFEQEEAPEKDLANTGWGVIFAADADPAIRYALRELLEHRKEQATAKHEGYYHEFSGKQGYRSGESSREFLYRQGVGLTRPTPDKMPYYLLIVGDPEIIPFAFQYQLDMQYAVGRIHFDTLDEYAHYARSVVLAETEDVILPRRTVVFAPANPGDAATSLSEKYLARPIVNGLKKAKPDWGIVVDQVSAEAADKARLEKLVGGDETPALLFTATHGMEFPLGDPRQLTHQGALLCQDWSGPESSGSISSDHYFSAEDVSPEAQLLGSIFFFWGCYGGATPKMDNFSQQSFRETARQIAPRDFIARLPQKVLGHPRGGALAVIGGVERKWGYSFISASGQGKDMDAFLYTLLDLMEEYPVGAAMEYFNQRYVALMPELISAIERMQFSDEVDAYDMARIWTAAIDARNYIIIGDPAVRLRVGDTNIAKRATIESGLRLNSEDEALLHEIGRAAAAWNARGKLETALRHQGESLQRIEALGSLLLQDNAHRVYIQACQLCRDIQLAAKDWESQGRPAVEATQSVTKQVAHIEATGLVFEEELTLAYVQVCRISEAERLKKKTAAKRRAEAERHEQKQEQVPDEKHQGKTFPKREQRQLKAASIITSAYSQTVTPYKTTSKHSPLLLADAGWGVIFAHDADPAIREALHPLLDRRREQATQQDERRFREFYGADGYRPGESAEDFISRHTKTVENMLLPDRVPYYLLIIGDPESIPFAFQYQLQTKHAVGRIHFEAVKEYAHYARAVVKAESEQMRRPRRVTFFGVQNPGDRITKMQTQYLIEPLSKALTAHQPRWNVQTITKDEATKARLRQVLGGDETPALLFTASHGMEFRPNNPQQLMHQGALLCQDWPGPEAKKKEILPDFYFSADDVGEEAQLSGLITFFFAPFGVGTPKLDNFAEQAFREPQTIAPKAFVARLPQRLLSHPNGGALAVIGHVERCWGYSFVSPEGETQIGLFSGVLKRLLQGYPVGAAMAFFNRYYAALSAALGALTVEGAWTQSSHDREKAVLLTVTKDARNYIIIGDPAVRLPGISGQNDKDTEYLKTVAATRCT